MVSGDRRLMLGENRRSVFGCCEVRSLFDVGKRRSGFMGGEGRSLFGVDGKGDRVFGCCEVRSLVDGEIGRQFKDEMQRLEIFA